ncbi:MAG: glutamate synthase-related protein, partial [Acidobacteriota bacterium]
LIRLPSPVISTEQFRWLGQLDDPAFRAATLDATWSVAAGVDGLTPAVEHLVRDAEQALDAGVHLLVLSDRRVGPDRAPIPMLLATAAVHHHLVRAQKRMRVSLVCDTAEPREDHHVACLLAYGATLVHPYLAYDAVLRRADERQVAPAAALANYRSALEKGLLKIQSRLGVSPMASYHGAKLFEALGLDRDLVERYFTGTPSRVDGVGPKVLAEDTLALHLAAFADDEAAEIKLPDRGLFRFRKGGEHHDFQPLAFKNLHRAVRTGSAEAFERYTESVDGSQPSRLRDLLTWRRAETPLPLDAVQPATEIASRFVTAAMSLGALSREAHETIAIGMNRIGGRSNSGEGGEARERARPYVGERPDFLGRFQPAAGDWGDSAIKQVASGRFGVTPRYLASARELEIKMAQGSKPGEGGQIPGHKVTPEIARLRRSVPGLTLISPPPHHDIYSIEDLAQLIYDLKRINGRARVGVKLVSLAGVGTIACGVAKAGADTVLVSGDDGGTGASPLSSIKHAGMPWELGLAETQQALVANGLRGRVTLRVDGGLKTGRDVVLAALLGAEEFGFGTAPLIAIGCVMARRCHLDTCPVGVATQRETLRAKFPGTPEHVVAFMLFVAEQVRHALAQIGLERLDDAIGRFDLLEAREDRAPVAGLDLAKLLVDPDPTGEAPRRSVAPRDASGRPTTRISPDGGLDDRVAEHAGAVTRYAVTNRDRSVGARLSGQRAMRPMAGAPLKIDFDGAAGQSFGAFLGPGLDFRLWGDAQDYVGKGLGGGRIVLRPPADARFVASDQVIAGNTLLYGATGGELFAAGRVGERFAVRNSGATAVIEGCGDHGCEYMTAGTVVVLGPTGRNFGA